MSLTVKALRNGAVQIRVNEEEHKVTPRWESKDILITDALLPCLSTTTSTSPTTWSLESSCIPNTPPTVVSLNLSPFSITVSQDSTPLVTINENNLFHFEHRRDRNNVPAATTPPGDDESSQDHHKGKKIVGYWEDGLARYEDGTTEVKPGETTKPAEEDEDGFWEETFSGHKDNKPNGPTSLGVDINFPLPGTHLFGIPEHASSMSLHKTRLPPPGVSTKGGNSQPHYKDPYRLYNLDVFEYDLDVPMALYGSIPLLMGHSAETGRTVGVFFNNPSETFVDIYDANKAGGMGSHWISESGVMEIFVLPGGPDVSSVYSQYTSLTGTQSLPPMFALGYHQCRWNYKDEKDVYAVHGKFEEHDYPYDVLWLDIEHTDGKRYFTWDNRFFPNPVKMQQALWEKGRRMVTIVDPHIKRDDKYYIHKEATKKGLYIKTEDGSQDFDGWCWPGSSSYLDFTSETVRAWWAEQFKLDKYIGSTPSLFIWNDMNEMSVFNGPEVTMQKTTTNLQGVEHRDWHNIYGMLFQRATAEGLVLRSGGKDRPFVLSRSFYAGSQRWGAIWTGDNAARWDHLEIAAPMLLTINIAGLSFAGADVGGFFGNADKQLMIRWMQAGAYTPFFRGHAHHDSARREPWVYGDETLAILRKAAMERYALLPFWYTQFYDSHTTGMPVMRPLWMNYPKDTQVMALDSQWMVGESLLVCPVVKENAVDVRCYFPGEHKWYDTQLMTAVDGKGWKTVEAPLDKIPTYQRSGTVVPRKMRLRRSSEMMKNDPYTLFIALDDSKEASGKLFLDDEKSFDYTTGKYDYRNFVFSQDTLKNVKIHEGAETFQCTGWIERLVFMGVERGIKAVKVLDEAGGSRDLEFTYDERTKVAVVRKPDLGLGEEWSVVIT